MSPVLSGSTPAESLLENPTLCCATCGSTAVIKSGHNSCGTQQYLCKNCGAHRVLHAKSRATDPDLKAQVLHAVEIERVSLREAERRFRIARQTIARWRKHRCLSSTPQNGASHALEKGCPNQGKPMNFIPGGTLE